MLEELIKAFKEGNLSNEDKKNARKYLTENVKYITTLSKTDEGLQLLTDLTLSYAEEEDDAAFLKAMKELLKSIPISRLNNKESKTSSDEEYKLIAAIYFQIQKTEKGVIEKLLSPNKETEKTIWPILFLEACMQRPETAEMVGLLFKQDKNKWKKEMKLAAIAVAQNLSLIKDWTFTDGQLIILPMVPECTMYCRPKDLFNFLMKDENVIVRKRIQSKYEENKLSISDLITIDLTEILSPYKQKYDNAKKELINYQESNEYKAYQKTDDYDKYLKNKDKNEKLEDPHLVYKRFVAIAPLLAELYDKLSETGFTREEQLKLLVEEDLNLINEAMESLDIKVFHEEMVRHKNDAIKGQDELTTKEQYLQWGKQFDEGSNLTRWEGLAKNLYSQYGKFLDKQDEEEIEQTKNNNDNEKEEKNNKKSDTGGFKSVNIVNIKSVDSTGGGGNLGFTFLGGKQAQLYGAKGQEGKRRVKEFNKKTSINYFEYRSIQNKLTKKYSKN